MDPDLAPLAPGIGVLEGIHDQFISDQSQRNGPFGVQGDVIETGLQPDVSRLGGKGLEQGFGQAFNVGAQVHAFEIGRNGQPFVDR